MNGSKKEIMYAQYNSEPGAEDNAEKVEFLSNKVKALEYQIVWEQ